MFILFILLTQLLCQNIFEQKGKINDTLFIWLNITAEQKQMLQQKQVKFDFKFDFPTLIKFEIVNRTFNIREEIILEQPQTQIGYFLSNDFTLFQRNLTIIIEPLPQYKNQWYRYFIQAHLNQTQLTRFQTEAGHSKNPQYVIYDLNMTYETSGVYEIEILGAQELALKQCVLQNCTEWFNEERILFNYSQIKCTEITKESLIDLCTHQVKVKTNNGTNYYLTQKHYSTAQVQYLKQNTIEKIDIQNKEASLMLGDQQKLNFLYSNSIIRGIQYCPQIRNYFESQIFIFSNQTCQIQEDWDQNFYIQTTNSNELKLQYINQVDIYYVNSVHRLQQEQDSYYFFCVETIFQQILFEIFVFDYDLLVQIYFSNTTQYPNEYENQFELIESNYKALQIWSNNKMYVGIKTKHQSLEYEISIKENQLNFLNLLQEIEIKYCKTCSHEHRFQAKQTGQLFLHIYLDQIENQIEAPQFNIIIINNGRVVTPIDKQISKSYMRIKFDVETDLTYVFVTRSKVQQNVRVLLSDLRFIEVSLLNEIQIKNLSEEVLRIKKNPHNTFYFYFYHDVFEKLNFTNVYGTCQYNQLSKNYFEVQCKNNVEDRFTYLQLEGVDESIRFIISPVVEENIKTLSQLMFESPLIFEQNSDSIILKCNFTDCSLIKCDLFLNVTTILEIEYKNQTKIHKNGYSSLSNFTSILDELYQPFQDIKYFQLSVQVPHNGNYYNFTSQKQRFTYVNFEKKEKLQNNNKYLQDYYALLYIVIVLLLGYLVIKMIFKKKVKIQAYMARIRRKKQFNEEEEEQIKIDDI